MFLCNISRNPPGALEAAQLGETRLCVLQVLTEVGVAHGLGRRQPLLVVVAQQLVQQVQRLRTHQVLVL